jgi:plastocyanin
MRTTTLTRLGAIGIASTALLFGACSDDDGGSSSTTAAQGGGEETTTTGSGGAAAGDGVVAEGFAFAGDVTAAPGADVSFQNNDGTPHSVTSDDDAWEEVVASGGEGASFAAPDEPGDYEFHCKFHGNMTATLHVEG